MTNEEIIEAFHSDKTITQVRQAANIRHNTVLDIWINHYGQAAVDERKRLKYRASKLGEKNPMKGRLKSLHPNWISSEKISNRKGYYRVRAPEWYEGKVSGGYVDEHILAYCESRQLTKVPDGYVIHHLDMVKTNNDPKNLVMLPAVDHVLLHRWIERVVVQRLSKLE